MQPTRLAQQYYKLFQHFSGQEIDTHLQQLADILCCTRRHMRNVLGSMQQAGWLDWQAQAGRGGRSRLRFCCTPESLQRDTAALLLEKGKVEQALNVLGNDRQELVAILLSRFGQHWRDNRQVLSIPYYRPLPDLYPGAALRRSERHLVHQIYSGLTAINEEKGEVIPDLAHHWQQKGPLEWHFHLRPNVRWHDGRLLNMQDVQDSLQGLQHLPLFAHIRDIRALTPRSLCIELYEPDDLLPWLLADSAALLLPSNHAEDPDFASFPVGTGPYRVVANDEFHLGLQAFDDYFGYRALLDEIDIWMVPELEVATQHIEQTRLEVHVSPVASAEHAKAMVAEQGCYFLLLGTRSENMRSAARRQWLFQQLSPLLLIQRIPMEIRQYWTVASSLLPQWFHLCQEPVAAAEGWVNTPLRLAYPAAQLDYPAIADAIQSCLAEFQIEVVCSSIAFTDWQQGKGEYDLWLGSANFTRNIDYSVPAWLLGTPLLRDALSPGYNDEISGLHRDWRQGKLNAWNLTEHALDQYTLLPLFHNWLRLQVSEGMQDLKLNALGWFDFKSVWHQ